MSRLSRYRRGSLVPHLIALSLLLAGAIAGTGGGDADSRGMLVAHAAPGPGGIDDAPKVPPDRLAGLDTATTPGARTYLAPNRPNPFSESTRIDFSLASRMNVTLKVYDFWYGEIETLIDNEEMEPGDHSARFVVAAGTTRAVAFSGMYFYELRAGGEIHQRRMLVIK